MEQLIQAIAIAALPVLFAITLHEAAHGYAARHFGDPTAWKLGRISVNPIRHIDLWGTIVIPIAIYVLSGGQFVFGWAKPVPVQFGLLRNPKRDMFWVAAAGPLANLAMACAWAVLMKMALVMPDNGYSLALMTMALVGVKVNAVLMMLNLLPLPPLDGGRIAVSLLPMHLARPFAQIERFGFIILLVLLFTGVLSRILDPFINAVYLLINSLI